METIIDYRLQNNHHEFLVHWKGYQRADNPWKPIENLTNSLELIQEYWKENHPTQPTPKITSHYVKATCEPIEVSTTPADASVAPNNYWEPYDNEEYDSSSSEVDYFPICDDGLLWHRDEDEEDEENWERL